MGTVPRYAECTAGSCVEGNVCLGFGGSPARCFPGCDRDHGCRGSDEACAPLNSLSFGICLLRNCDPFRCGAGQTCAVTYALERNELLGCVAEGTVPLGGSCAQGQCAAPGFCANVGAGPVCKLPCNADHPCSGGTCVYFGDLDFGSCEPN